MIVKIKKIIAAKILSDDLLKKFISGAFWSVLGNVIVKGLSLIAGLFVAKFLGSISFGELSIIKSTISVFGLLASFGLGFTITKLVGENIKKNIDEVGEIISATNLIVFFSAIFFSLVLFVSAPYIAVSVFENDTITLPLRFAGVFLFFNAVNIYQLGLISGFQLFKGLARINMILGAISFPTILLLTYFFGLKGTIGAMILNMSIGCFLNYILIKRSLKNLGVIIFYRNLKKSVKRILRFSFPLALKEIIYSSGNWITYYILLQKSSFGEVGVFNSANQLSQIILFLPAAMLGVSLSLLSNYIDHKENYNALIKKSLQLNCIVVVLIGSGMAIFSSLIYDFYGASYDGGQVVLYILIFTTIPMSIISVFEQVCISSSKTKVVTLFTFLGQVLIIVSAIILFTFIEKATSLAYSYLIGYSIFAVVMYLYLKKQKIITC